MNEFSARLDPGKAAERRKKKNFYAKMKKDEEDKMAELAAKYRDRAAERRDGGESVPGADDTATAYRYSGRKCIFYSTFHIMNRNYFAGRLHRMRVKITTRRNGEGR